MSEIGIGWNLDQMNKELTDYFQTEEGRQALLDFGINESIYLDSNKSVPGGGKINETDKTVFIRDGRVIERTTYSDGTFVDQDLGEADMGGTTPSFEPRVDARNILREVLSTYKLDALTEALYGKYTRQEFDINNPDAILFSIRDEELYKTRFSANTARVKAGLPELSPGEYLSLEQKYSDLMRQNGLPPGFYDQEDDYKTLIENDISPLELQSRIEDGFRMVDQADPAVLNQLRQFFPEVGLDRSALASYFLDPQRSAPLLARQVETAKIAARAAELAGVKFNYQEAADLAGRGYSESTLLKGFEDVGALGELNQTFAGEADLTGQQLVGAKLGYDTEAKRKLAEKVALRRGEFLGGGQFSAVSGDYQGAVRSGAGKAQ
jgi:hypothetical protein